jgi:hypothetical protein
VPLPNVVTPVGENGGGIATEAKVYADDLFADEAIKFVEANRDRPFFFTGAWSFRTPTTSGAAYKATAHMRLTLDRTPRATGPSPTKGTRP